MTDIQIAGVTLSDPDLTEADVELAWGVIQEECGWHVAPVVEHTLTLDGNGAPVLALPSLRVVEVLSVFVDGVDVTDDVQWSEAGLLRRKSCRVFPKRYRSVVVTLRHGFDSMPRALAALTKRGALNADGGSKQIMAGPFLEINRDEDADGALGFSKAAKAALARYRLPGLPS